MEWKVAGMCHSDEHMVTGDMVPDARGARSCMGDPRTSPDHRRPRGRRGRARGRRRRHAAEARRPRLGRRSSRACGRCRYCSTGTQNLCDNGADTFIGGHDHRRHRAATSSTARADHADRQARHVRDALVRGRAVGDQGRATTCRWSAVALVSLRRRHRVGLGRRAGRDPPGDTVVVVGIGGIGINAVQGAKMAGAKHVIAVDPIEFKREKAHGVRRHPHRRVDGGGDAGWCRS